MWSRVVFPLHHSLVIAGLVPAIHGLVRHPLDHRDKPGGDGGGGAVFWTDGR